MNPWAAFFTGHDSSLLHGQIILAGLLLFYLGVRNRRQRGGTNTYNLFALGSGALILGAATTVLVLPMGFLISMLLVLPVWMMLAFGPKRWTWVGIAALAAFWGGFLFFPAIVGEVNLLTRIGAGVVAVVLFVPSGMWQKYYLYNAPMLFSLQHFLKDYEPDAVQAIKRVREGGLPGLRNMIAGARTDTLTLWTAGFGLAILGAWNLVQDQAAPANGAMIADVLVVVGVFYLWGIAGFIYALRREVPKFIVLRGIPALVLGLGMVTCFWSFSVVFLLGLILHEI